MLKVLLIASLIKAQVPDGGVPFDAGSSASDAGASDAPLIVLEVQAGELLVREPNLDAGTDVLVQMHVNEGCYEPTESCLRIGKKEAKLTGEVQSWNTADLKWVGVAFSAGAVTGIIVGAILGALAAGKK